MNLSPENWLKDKRGNWSFTRIAPAICLLAALIIWAVGTHWKELQGYCQQIVDKLLDFSKYCFGIGKGTEEVGAAFSKPENSTTTSSSTVRIETPKEKV